MNSDTSSRFIGSKFDIHLIVLSSAAWLAHEMHSDTIPIFSAKGFETQEFVAQLLPMMLTGCIFDCCLCKWKCTQSISYLISQTNVL